MKKLHKNSILALASLSALAILVSAFPVLAVTAPAPSTVETSPKTPTEDRKSELEAELSERRALIASSQQSTAAGSREIDVDAILGGLEASANVTQATRQQFLASLGRLGFKAEERAKFRQLRANKNAVDLNLRIPRIIGGQILPSTSETPWQVALVRAGSKNIWIDQFCGGSIIGTRWILTAAHCVDWLTAKQISVVSGVATLPQGIAPTGTSSAVKNVIIHPMWPNSYFNSKVVSDLYDIALLELSAPLTFKAGVRSSIGLPQANPVLGQGAYVSGWGRTEDGNWYPQLKGGTTPIVECEQDYGITVICAGSNNTSDANRVDACNGDSGGPLTQTSSVGRVLVGVVSFGPPCPGERAIGGYANVKHFAPWIMCHAEVTTPFGGPYFCGDEAGLITVADTLKVAKGEWGGRTPATFKWFNGNNLISGQTKSSLPLSGRYGQRISVEISVPGTTPRRWNFTELTYYDEFDNEITEHFPVEMATNVTVYPSGDFVPCTSFSPRFEGFVPPLGGSCSGTKGQENGSLQTPAGTANGRQLVFDDEESSTYWWTTQMPRAFFAFRDVTLPKNTEKWTWGIYDAWSRGTDADGYDYPIFGSSFLGGIAPSKINPSSTADWDDWDTFFSVKETPIFPEKLTEAFALDPDLLDFSAEPCFSFISGPMEPYPGEFGCETDFSRLLTANKGRLVMGTFGSESLGTRFTFSIGVVVAIHK